MGQVGKQVRAWESSTRAGQNAQLNVFRATTAALVQPGATGSAAQAKRRFGR